MSECVVRMEMPQNCCHCPMIAYADKIKWVDNGRETEGAYICLFTKELIDNTKRADDCPIICSLPEGHGRLVDADAYSAEMKDRQEAAWKWRNEAIAEEDEVKLARAEGAYTAFTEAKLTMDKHIISQRNRVEEPPKEGE